MPLKFDTKERCRDCNAWQPTDRSPEYKYEAPTTCHSCHSWNDSFHTTLVKVEVRTGFRWNGGWDKPGKFD